jgi:hypothetical protein
MTAFTWEGLTREQQEALMSTIEPPPPDLGDAVHEAGHAIAAALCGLKVYDAEVFATPREDAGIVRLGLCRYEGVSNVFGSGQRHHPVVSAAGAAAQAVYLYGGACPDLLGRVNALLAGSPDEADLRQAVVASGEPAQVFTDRAVKLVLRGWPAICGLALDMHGGKSVRHKDVLAALGVRYDNDAGFALASVRAGLRAVPVPGAPRR